MENSPWRLVFFSAGFSLVLLILVYFFVLPKNPEKATDTTVIADGNNLSVRGYSNGKDSWSIKAKSSLIRKGSQSIELSEIIDGAIFDHKDKVVTQIKSSSGFVEKERFFLRDNFSLNIKLGKNLFKTSAEYGEYNIGKGIVNIYGSIEAISKKTRIYCGEINFDINTRAVTFLNQPIFKKDKAVIRGDKFIYHKDKNLFEGLGNIKIEIADKGKKTTLLSQTLQAENGFDGKISGSTEVLAKQSNKKIRATAFEYNSKTKKISFSGKAFVEIAKGKDLLSSKSTKKIDRKEIKESLLEKTFLEADTVTLSTENGDFEGNGNVKTSQKGKEGKSSYALYDSVSEVIKMSDNVFLKKENGEWLKCQSLIVSIPLESFEASGGVEGEF